MLKKTIVYANPFTEENVSEDHYFHISKADLIEMEMEEHSATYEKDGQKLTGMQAKLQRIVDAKDGKAIMTELKSIIQRSYGKKSGDRFIKSKEIWEEFSATEAFSQLLFELCTDAGASAEFMNGVVPGNLEQIAAEVRAQAEDTVPPTVTAIAAFDEAEERQVNEDPTASIENNKDSTGLTNVVTPQVLTTAEVLEMDALELKSGLASGKYKLS